MCFQYGRCSIPLHAHETDSKTRNCPFEEVKWQKEKVNNHNGKQTSEEKIKGGDQR